MQVVIFGATGMIGHGVLRQSLLDPRVDGVLVVGRSPTGWTHAKLREIVRPDLGDLTPASDDLAGLDACFYCLGVSSAGMREAAYRRVTYDLTMAAARPLAARNPGMRFLYVSGAGTDSTGRGRVMWARVKGETENALFAMPLDAYAFRPAYIQPMHGAVAKSRLYRAAYAVAAPAYPLLRRLMPGQVTTNEAVGRAMLTVAAEGWGDRILTTRDINRAAQVGDARA